MKGNILGAKGNILGVKGNILGAKGNILGAKGNLTQKVLPFIINLYFFINKGDCYE